MEAIDKEKVIAEIKELYNDIDKCISELIAARGNHDGNGISNAHLRMETLMVNTQQAICNVIDTFETKEVNLTDRKTNWSPSKKQVESLGALVRYNIGVFDYQKLTEVALLYEVLLNLML